MHRIRLACYLLPLVIVLGCGGQSAQPKTDNAPPADTSAVEDPAPGAAAAPGEEAIAVPDAMPGPLQHGPLDALGVARILSVDGGHVTEAAIDVAVRIHLESQKSERGFEILASIGTPASKTEGGFLYFTGSTGGGPDSPPAPADLVREGTGTDEHGNWHYGVLESPTQVGLLNVTDLAAKSTTLFAAGATIPESVAADKFEAVIDSEGICILTAAGALPDGRRLVISATTTGPILAQKAVATENDAAPVEESSAQ